jgi:hypothetical protein
MAKRYSTRSVKKNHNYTAEELADLLKVHIQTVRTWMNTGLRSIRDQVPFLILGSDVIAYLDRKRGERKRSLDLNQLFCIRCKAAVVPDGELADYIPRSDKHGRLEGICRDCEGICARYVRHDNMHLIAPDLDIAFPSAESTLNESARLPLKTHSLKDD